MSEPEIKKCSQCKKEFECNKSNIKQCQCYGIELTAKEKAFIEQNYFDCLCLNCLKKLKKKMDTTNHQGL